MKINLNVLPAGTYPALTSGYVAKVIVGDRTVSIKFDMGVRGINIPDTITVNKDGTVVSKLLGQGFVEAKHAGNKVSAG